MKVIKYLILLSLIVFLTSGCAGSRRVIKGADILTVYNSAVRQGVLDSTQQIKQDFRMKRAFGTTAPYVPIRQPGEVKKIWIPDHVFSESDDVLISGHWVYIVVRDEGWFIQDRTSEKAFPETVPFKHLDIDLGGAPIERRQETE